MERESFKNGFHSSLKVYFSISLKKKYSTNGKISRNYPTSFRPKSRGGNWTHHHLIPEKLSANKGGNVIWRIQKHIRKKKKMDGFPLRCVLETQVILIKSANLLHHWSSLEPVTLMEETIYQKPIHFTTFSMGYFFFALFCKLKQPPFSMYKCYTISVQALHFWGGNWAQGGTVTWQGHRASE